MVDKDAKPVSINEIEAEDAVSLPNKEVMSLLDVNANVDLGLDLAAPVDLAAAANLNVAAPIEASAGANVLSPDAKAIGYASQSGSIDQGMSGTTADATAPQHAVISQDATGGSEPTAGGTTGAGAGDGSITAGVGGTADATGGATSGVGGAVGGVLDGAGGTVGGVTGATGGATGGVESLLSGGNLLDANVNIDAQANLTAPIDGAVAANANVAAPIDAAVAANVGSEGATAEALAPQQVNISQHLDNVSATAHAEQDAEVDQK